jgi:hypothetical protein
MIITAGEKSYLVSDNEDWEMGWDSNLNRNVMGITSKSGKFRLIKWKGIDFNQDIDEQYINWEEADAVQRLEGEYDLIF